jgi:hypothetical protein
MLVTVLVTALALSGCSKPPTPEPLSVAVFQLRSDSAIRGAQIELTNHGSTPLEITSASLRSSWFVGTMTSPSTPTQLLPKTTVDLRITLADPRCGSEPLSAAVELRYLRADGSRESATMAPSVPFESLATVHGQDCSKAAFEKVVSIAVSPTLRFDPAGPAGGGRAALVDVTFTPTGAEGSAILHSTEDTTLLAQREGTIRPIEQSFSRASPAVTVTLDYVPASCLPHRVAEDKVGTLIPMRVDAGGYRDALFSVAVPDSLKSELLDWVGSYCGW